jgi:hypothetical protein
MCPLSRYSGNLNLPEPSGRVEACNGIVLPSNFYLYKLLKKEHIKEIMGVKGKPDIIQRKRLHWYGHVKRMPEERIPKLIMEWKPRERRKRGRPRKTWMEGVQTALTTRNLELEQWRNRQE